MNACKGLIPGSVQVGFDKTGPCCIKPNLERLESDCGAFVAWFGAFGILLMGSGNQWKNK